MTSPAPASVGTPPTGSGAAFTTRPTLTGTFGMVATTHWIASQSAQAMLERGGNAVDAAACAGFVLHVVEPHLNGPGGDLVGLVAMRDGDPGQADAGYDVRLLDGQGPAPAAASAAAYREMGLDLVPGGGPLAAAVPGAVDALLLMQRDHGTLPVSTVLEPALAYARDGHPVLAAVSRTIGTAAALFRESWTTSADQWLVDGEAPEPGTLVTSPGYARILQAMADAADAAGEDVAGQAEAARATWRRSVAEPIERFAARSTRHSGGTVLPGVITAADVTGWEARWERPLTLEFRGVTLHKAGPWTQGPTLLQVLGILERRAAQTGDAAVLDPDTAIGAHALVEAWKLAMADREAFFGDAGGLDTAGLEALGGDLVADDYLRQRAAAIGEQVRDGLHPGAPGGRDGVLPEHVRRAVAGLDAPVERDSTVGEPTVAQPGGEDTAGTDGNHGDPDAKGDTCHIDVVDRWGQMVSLTPSGGWLQSSPTIPDLGFCLGTRLQMCWLEEGLPATLTPGRRPRTTLTPTLVTDAAGVPVLSCGSPGGDQQDQWQSAFLLRRLAQGAGLQQAIDAPMLHSRHAPESFWPREAAPQVIALESRTAPEVQDDLAARGHVLQDAGPWALGRLSAVGRDPITGVLSAAANPRGMQGYAVGR